MHNIRRAKFFKKSISEVSNQKFDLIVSNPPYIEKIKVKTNEKKYLGCFFFNYKSEK